MATQVWSCSQAARHLVLLMLVLSESCPMATPPSPGEQSVPGFSVHSALTSSRRRRRKRWCSFVAACMTSVWAQSWGLSACTPGHGGLYCQPVSSPSANPSFSEPLVTLDFLRKLSLCSRWTIFYVVPILEEGNYGLSWYPRIKQGPGLYFFF